MSRILQINGIFYRLIFMESTGKYHSTYCTNGKRIAAKGNILGNGIVVDIKVTFISRNTEATRKVQRFIEHKQIVPIFF